MTEQSIETSAFAARLDHQQVGIPGNVRERSALVRIAVLSRLLREALYEIEMEIPSAQLTQELTALEKHAEAELNR